MDTNSPPPVLSIGAFLLLRDLINDRLGVWFDESKLELLSGKLADRIVALGLRSFLDYFYLLKYESEAAAEWEQVSDALSVQETYFWREIDQVRAFVDILLPQQVAAGNRSVKIWSAACASGEEPLTIAMALQEAGWLDRIDVELHASDLSPAAIDRAVTGIYRERSFRALPIHLRDKYFRRVEQGWQIDPRLQARVQFRSANLLNPNETAELCSAGYIFCRNVFIYFSQATVARVISRFASAMAPPGYLFVGVSESLLRITAEFELNEAGGAFLYVRR